MFDRNAEIVRTSYRIIWLAMIGSAFALLSLGAAWTSRYLWLDRMLIGFSLLMTGLQVKLQRDAILSANASASRVWMRPAIYAFCVGGVLLFLTGIAHIWTPA